jgi:hypothetical protein
MKCENIEIDASDCALQFVTPTLQVAAFYDRGTVKKTTFRG